jgi:hypothetical protein
MPRSRRNGAKRRAGSHRRPTAGQTYMLEARVGSQTVSAVATLRSSSRAAAGERSWEKCGLERPAAIYHSCSTGDEPA